jgi:hypothetical protein
VNAPAIRLNLASPRLRLAAGASNKNAPNLAERGADEPVKFVAKDKSTPKSPQVEPESLDDLLKEIAGELQSLGVKRGDRILQLLDRLHARAADRDVNDEEKAVLNGTETPWGRSDEKLGARSPQRHDGKRVPSGYEAGQWGLMRMPRPGVEAERAEASEVGKALLLGLASWFEVPNGTSELQFLSNLIQEITERAVMLPSTEPRLAKLLKAYEELAERDYNEPAWIRALERRLHGILYRMTADRIKQGRRGKAEPPAPEDLAGALESMRRSYPDLPTWMNAEVASNLLEKSTLAKPGGGRYRLIDLIRKTVESRAES